MAGLRLAVILHRNRSISRTPAFTIVAKDNHVSLQFPEGWLEAHSLTHADLMQEQELLANGDFKLKIS